MWYCAFDVPKCTACAECCCGAPTEPGACIMTLTHRPIPPIIFSQCHERKSVPRQIKPQIGYGTMSRGPLKTEIHCEIVEIRIIVDCIKYELNNCNTLSLFIFFILGDPSPRVSLRQQNRFVVVFVVALTSARGTDLKWWVGMSCCPKQLSSRAASWFQLFSTEIP